MGYGIEVVERDYVAEWSLDHTMIRVEDADQALGFWTRKFLYEYTRRWEAVTFANYFMKPEGAGKEAMSVELTYSSDGRTYDFGDAWGHLSVRVDYLQDDWETLLEREAADYRGPASCDNLYAFTKDQLGNEIEVLERDFASESLFPV